MKLTNHGSVPVYTISGSSTARPLPEWLARQRRRSLKQDPEYANRIELLQDFEFEEASTCVRVSEDGDWVVSTGTYKPQIHVHYLPHLSLSYARHTNAENQTFLLLSSDYSKQLHLQTDRFLEFHTPQGCHYTTRIPRYGRDLLYDRRSAEALIPCVGVDSEGDGEVYRLNLEVGRFMKPYSVDVGGDDYTSVGGGALQGGINTGSINTGAIAEDSHNLLAFGTSLGTVEFWDSRSRARIGVLGPPPAFSDSLIPSDTPTRAQITALEFHHSGLTIATGSSTGLVHLYDLRSPTPLLKKDQGYGYPIHTLTFLDSPSSKSGASSHFSTDTPKIMSADKRIIKIWDSQDGTPWTHVEAAVDMHNVAWCRDSGMFLTSNEGRQQHSFFVPGLGPAPRWCSFLDNLVEEMAEDADDPNAFHSSSQHKGGEVYDNYKFVTPKELAALGLEDKIGTGLLKPYMHGYFMRQELYEEARLIAQPEIWAERRQQSIREKIEKERESRIRGSKKQVNAKVNKKLAERMLEREEKNERRKAKREVAKSVALREAGNADSPQVSEDEKEDRPKVESKRNNVLTDSRFVSLFQDEDFAIDETSHEFRSLNPSTNVDEAPREGRKLTAVEEEELADRRANRNGSSSASSDGDDSEDSDEDDAAMQRHKQRQKQKNSAEELSDKNKISSASYRRSGHRPRGERGEAQRSSAPKMQAWRTGEVPVAQRRDISFGSRLKSAADGRSGSGRRAFGGSGAVVGEKEITFVPNSKGPKRRNGEQPGYSGGQRSNKDRRSASGNTLRRL